MGQFRGIPPALVLGLQPETHQSDEQLRRKLPAVSGRVILTAVRFGSAEAEQAALISPSERQFDVLQ